MSRAATTWRTLGRPARASAVVWIAGVILAAILTSWIFTCVTPFAALGAVCALHLRRRAAALAMTGVWLANQVIGFAFLGYPHDPTTLAWGGALLIATLAGTGGAAITAALVRRAGTALRGGLAVAVAYVTVQGVIAVAGLFLHGDAFSLALQRELILLNAGTFAVVLVVGHALDRLLARADRTLPSRRPTSSRPSGGLPV